MWSNEMPRYGYYCDYQEQVDGSTDHLLEQQKGEQPCDEKYYSDCQNHGASGNGLHIYADT
jgi:hypothetical protein